MVVIIGDVITVLCCDNLDSLHEITLITTQKMAIFSDRQGAKF